MSISKNSQNLQLDTKRHSFAHIMAAAVSQMFPEAQFGVGPVIDHGCYYDFILPRTLIPEDLPLIENKIKELLKRNIVFKRQEVSLEEAIALFEKMNQPLKVELLQDLATRGTTSMSEEERADFDALEATPQAALQLDPLKEVGGVDFDPTLNHKVTAVVRNSEGKFLILRRAESDSDGGKWDLPGGGLEAGETLEMAVCRELKEEAGIDRQSPEFIKTFEFEHPKAGKIYSHFFGFQVDTEHVILSDDHSDHRWIALDEAKNYDLLYDFVEGCRLFETMANVGIYKEGNPPTITIYRLEDEDTGEDLFVDLCKGPHIGSVREFDKSTVSSTKVFFLHGRSFNYNNSFYKNVGNKLSENGFEVVYLDIKDPLNGKKDVYLESLIKNKEDLKNSIVIAHSISGLAVSRFLSEYDVHISELHLIGPVFGEKQVSNEGYFGQVNSFLDIEINYQKINSAADRIYLHHSKDDSRVSFENSLKYKSELPKSILKEYQGYDHFAKFEEGKPVDQKIEFPELAELILNRVSDIPIKQVKGENQIKSKSINIKKHNSLSKIANAADVVVNVVSASLGSMPGGAWFSEVAKSFDPGEITVPVSGGKVEQGYSVSMQGLGFSLDKFSGAYWRGDQERNIQMQRIYALVFETKEEILQFQEQREEAKKRDHRKLGQDMEIFMVSEEVGSGLPLYLPNGATIRQLLEKYCYQEAKKAGYQYVYTPHIGKSDLFARSGHLDHYADGMFAPIDMVNLKGEGAEEGGKTEKFYLKPMNCPMHHNIYLNKPRSYRDLPYRLYEYGTVYRYEESGTLSGMIRVRGFTQNDAHVYCQRSQLKEVIGEALTRFMKAYQDIGINNYKMRFSLPDFVNDKEKYGEETEEWIEAVSAMRQVLDELGVDYYEAIGEAAFYGPKIDIQVRNVNGKEDSLSTIQVDYSIAPKFDITFKNAEGADEVPAIIHMALMGSVDRFMAFMLEMTGGRLPFWLAPTQVKILTVNNSPEVLDYVSKIISILDETVLMKPLKYNEIRYETDDRNESLGKKIREATTQKIPVQIIVGPKDIEADQVSVRTQEGESKVSLEGLRELLLNL